MKDMSSRPLPNPEDDIRYSYLELVGGANSDRRTRMNQQAPRKFETGDYLEPIPRTARPENASTGKPFKVLQDEDEDHQYQDIHNYYEIMK